MATIKQLINIAEHNDVNALMIERLKKHLNATIIRNIAINAPEDITRIGKCIPKELYDEWFKKVINVAGDIAVISDEGDFIKHTAIFVDSMPKGYLSKFSDAYPFHGHIKDRIIKAILASKAETDEAKQIKQGFLQYLTRRKSRMRVSLGSDIHVSTKLKGEKLCLYLSFLKRQIATPNKIIGLPTEDDVRIKAMDMLLSGNQAKVNLYHEALRAVNILSTISETTRFNDNQNEDKDGRDNSRRNNARRSDANL